jgi:hypothetical protein
MAYNLTCHKSGHLSQNILTAIAVIFAKGSFQEVTAG